MLSNICNKGHTSAWPTLKVLGSQVSYFTSVNCCFNLVSYETVLLKMKACFPRILNSFVIKGEVFWKQCRKRKGGGRCPIHFSLSLSIKNKETHSEAILLKLSQSLTTYVLHDPTHSKGTIRANLGPPVSGLVQSTDAREFLRPPTWPFTSYPQEECTCLW